MAMVLIMAMVLFMAMGLWVAIAVVVATGIAATISHRGSAAPVLDAQDSDPHARAA